MEYQSPKLEVASADKMVTQCDVVNVITRTSEGNIGILPGRKPLVVTLMPCMMEIVVVEGRTKIFAIDGGSLAATQGHIRILSHEVKLAKEILLQEVHLEVHKLRHLRSEGEVMDEQVHRLHTPNAQTWVGKRYQASH